MQSLLFCGPLNWDYFPNHLHAHNLILASWQNFHFSTFGKSQQQFLIPLCSTNIALRRIMHAHRGFTTCARFNNIANIVQSILCPALPSFFAVESVYNQCELANSIQTLSVCFKCIFVCLSWSYYYFKVFCTQRLLQIILVWWTIAQVICFPVSVNSLPSMDEAKQPLEEGSYNYKYMTPFLAVVYTSKILSPIVSHSNNILSNWHHLAFALNYWSS